LCTCTRTVPVSGVIWYGWWYYVECFMWYVLCGMFYVVCFMWCGVVWCGVCVSVVWYSMM
jgi:hypothetical protein